MPVGVNSGRPGFSGPSDWVAALDPAQVSTESKPACEPCPCPTMRSLSLRTLAWLESVFPSLSAKRTGVAASLQ